MRKTSIFFILINLLILNNSNLYCQTLKILTVSEIPNSSLFIPVNEKNPMDAMIMIYSGVENIKFNTNNIPFDGYTYDTTYHRYIIYTAPDNKQIITVIHNEYQPIYITIPPLTKKEVVVYKIEPKINEEQGQLFLSTIPSGASITITGIPDFNKTTPFLFKGYETRDYLIHLAKEKYKTLDTVITIEKRGHSVNFILQPLTGSLSITTNIASAKVYIDNEYIGTSPINNYKLQIGNYKLKIEHGGYATYDGDITINTNEAINLSKDLKVFKSIKIMTNPSNCDVFIDSKKVNDGSYIDIALGIHTITIKKENYQLLTTALDIGSNLKEMSVFTYSLTPKVYRVAFKTRPSNGTIEVDGYRVSSGGTINLPYGSYKIKASRRNCFAETKRILIDTSNTKFNINLVPHSTLNLNLIYGLNFVGGEIGGTFGHFYIGFQYSQGSSNYTFPYPTQLSNYQFYPNNGDTYVGKQGIKDSSGSSTILKVGVVINKPFQFVITLGYMYRKAQPYYEIYQAGNNYVNNYGTINQGQYFVSTNLISNQHYTSPCIGVELHPLNHLNISIDYAFSSELQNNRNGSGFIVGVGYNFFSF